MNDVKALICCNNPISIPGLREFLFYGKVAAIVITRRNKEMRHILEHLLEGTGVPLIQVQKKNFITELREALELYQPTVGLLKTFPFILPPELLAMPPRGFINFHYGLLPECRGPQPVLRHLLNNDTHAGVTVHKMDAGIDTGEIILRERVPIAEDDTYGTLQTKLAYTGGKLAAELLRILTYATLLPSVPQDESQARYLEMPTAEELTIRWDQMTAAAITRLVNACNPWNKGAGTRLGDWVVGITEVKDLGPAEPGEAAPGTILACSPEQGVIVKTLDNRRLKLMIIYTQEGFFSGERMASMGWQAGQVLA